MQREQNENKKELWGNFKSCNIPIIGRREEKRKEGNRKNILNNNGWVPIKINGSDQNTYYWTPSRINKQAKFYPGISYISCTSQNKIVEE